MRSSEWTSTERTPTQLRSWPRPVRRPTGRREWRPSSRNGRRSGSSAELAEAVTRSEPDVVTKVSPGSVSQTVSRFTDLLEAKGVRLFAVIDQADEARQVGL